MILMVPLMIEAFARKLEEVRAAGLPAEPVRKKIFERGFIQSAVEVRT